LTAADVATRLGLPVRVVYRLASSRQITALRPNGRLLGIYEADLNSWVRRHRIEEGTPPRETERYSGVDAWVDSLLKPQKPSFAGR
jgi:excisionase family DNA binding protein